MGILIGMGIAYILLTIAYMSLQLVRAVVIFFIECYQEYRTISRRNKYRAKVGLPKIK